ncbi:hypothetical protein SAMN06272735_4761 [Streptomyces sp. TLI_55]|uniref:hypothetical protein n=1 Tax=Streptomyces sp. TLI_55 TaxID=1938861 RepID=UPI000BD44449|nr:hypothetical protein [Streptomyces sp. TLI_55]SNX62964.1 hypothetical protein SAMN06272735_4761 [Streptomyces sp. TLI_55]
MYALIVPASTPFVLLITVMALSWWEDHILPPSTEPAESPAESPAKSTAEAPLTPVAPAQLPELARVDTALTGEVAGR